MLKFERDSFVKDNLDLSSPDLFNWDMILVSSLYKKEYKDDENEKEVINGYANAVDCIANGIKVQNHPGVGVLAFRSNSLVVPFIFLCRHTVELILKYLRKCLGLNTPNKHGLLYLWDEIEKTLIEANPSVTEAIAGLREYISVLEELDPDGSHSRYSKSPKGEPYHNKPKFVRVVTLNEVLQKVLLPLIDKKM